jgi:probable rRNA maturation factor
MPSDGSQSGPRLRVSVVDDDGRPLRASALAAWLAGVAPPRARGALTIAVVSDRCVRALNRRYRGVDRSTDVLSFPAASNARPGVASDIPSHRAASAGLTPGVSVARRAGGAAPFLGDIVIARGVAARQAREAGHPERVEWRVLALHGLLHLLGYDHEQDAGEMRRLEQRLRRKGGLDSGLIERGRAG